jgi:hypothetical protein
MPSDLDKKFDAVLAAVTKPGEGRIQLGQDSDGRAIVTNLPPTLPTLFDIFCSLHGQVEAVVAGEERLTFADLNVHATGLARALVGRGIVKGDRVAIAMRNCPSWIVTYMAALKAGRLQPWSMAGGSRTSLPMACSSPIPSSCWPTPGGRSGSQPQALQARWSRSTSNGRFRRRWHP